MGLLLESGGRMVPAELVESEYAAADGMAPEDEEAGSCGDSSLEMRRFLEDSWGLEEQGSGSSRGAEGGAGGGEAGDAKTSRLGGAAAVTS
jgi:hypothetical protein